jgi:hypothetical protein
MNTFKYSITKDHPSTWNEYIKLPIEKRTTKVWFWPGDWYLSPIGMAMDFTDEGEIISEWDIFHKEMSKLYPIQYSIRNFSDWFWIRAIKYKYSFLREKFIYPIKCAFKSRNAHIQKQIPNTWKSNDEIIEDVLYSIFLKEYLPDKKNHWRSGETESESPGGTWYEKSLEFDACYDWFNNIKPTLEKDLERLYFKEFNKKDFLARHEIVSKIEKEIKDGDTKYLNWIVTNRNEFD